MDIYVNPTREELAVLLGRATVNKDELVKNRVVEILSMVKSDGDKAIFELTKNIDGVDLSEIGLVVSQQEIEAADLLVHKQIKDAILVAKHNIYAFHSAQQHKEVRVKTQKGVECWQRSVPINRVGLYVPGGTAPLFSTVIMLAVPAKIAGCREIVLCTPARNDGTISPEILFTARLCGVDKIYKIGGAMAIGALAYGSQSIEKVDKIFGPGNAYVTTAKQIVSLFDTAIDMPAGPSEVMVVGDATANPAFVASDLLSQAEHGSDSQAIFITTDNNVALRVAEQIDVQLESLSRKQLVENSLKCSRIIVVDEIPEVVDIINDYAPEHLIISMDEPYKIVDRVECAGSIFIGHYTPESAGDYASGTNHTLPTNGWAKSYSGVNLDSFTKKITYQSITKEGLRNLGNIIEIMADAEGLTAHRNAVSIRLK